MSTLGDRAARMLKSAKAEPQTRAVFEKTSKLSPERRLRAWAQMTTKLLVVLRSFNMKMQATPILGKATYLRIFSDIKKRDAQQEAKASFDRVLQGELVGQLLSSSNTSKESTMTVAACQHPAARMKKRGNKAATWWTCLECQGRWERIPMPEMIGEPTGAEVAMFGKHVGKTFKEILKFHRGYAQWAIQEMEHAESASEQLMRFAQFARAELNQEAVPMETWSQIPTHGAWEVTIHDSDSEAEAASKSS